jgi:phospholipid/cholesterol/gamma-HCH transport system permease protein
VNARPVFGPIGRFLLGGFRFVGGVGRLLAQVLYWSLVGPFHGRSVRLRHVIRQMVRVGFYSVPINCLVLLFVGMILCFQMARVLEYLSPETVIYTADAVGKAMALELGPLLTAVVMSGFVGAAMAAEIGTMKVSEEILALEAGAINPIRFLVAPRFWGAVVMFPCLTVIGETVGILGGLLVGVAVLRVPAGQYLAHTRNAILPADIFQGLVKSVAFGIVVVLIACYQGLRVRGGAEGVGKATTASVVKCIEYIILVDCALTILFFYVWR